jgi:hypothetical protein
MKIGTGVQAILKFCLRNLRGCNVGITDEKGGCSTQLKWLRWHGIYNNIHDDRFRHSSNIKVITERIYENVMLVLLKAEMYEVRR